MKTTLFKPFHIGITVCILAFAVTACDESSAERQGVQEPGQTDGFAVITPEPPKRVGPPDDYSHSEYEPCKAADYVHLIGQNKDTFSSDDITQPHRIYGPNDMVTMDYINERLNIVTDEQGVVKRLKCG